VCHSDLSWNEHRAAFSLEVNASLTAQKHGFGLVCLKFCVHMFPGVFGEVSLRHHKRVYGILRVHTASDIHKPGLLQTCIQFISGKKVTIFYRAMQTSQAVLTTSNFSKLITFLNIIKEKS
jgi:hypothetical protein